MAQLTSELERINQKYARADQTTRTPRALLQFTELGEKIRIVFFKIILIENRNNHGKPILGLSFDDTW